MPSSREKQAERRRLKYCRYRDLCAELGVQQQSKRWDSHYAQLRRENGEQVRRAPEEPWVPLTKQQILAWWCEQKPFEELQTIGAYMDTTSREDGSAV